ncbi:MAG TPA: hypothetical protein VNJ52_05160 [Patescibacteria group bacterium]|nr:hypothetical protein [Patescibacteria group bacterium]
MKRLRDNPKYRNLTYPKRWNLQQAEDGKRNAADRQKGWKMVQGRPRPASERPRGFFT